MKHRKKTGSFYTPAQLAEFIFRYVSPHFDAMTRLSIFEPSVGDGSFVKAFRKSEFSTTIKNFSFSGIDKVKPELKKAETAALADRKLHTKYSFTKIDFLKHQQLDFKKYGLIVGNPPYIKKQLLNKTQLQLCKSIHDEAGLSQTSVKNIWTAFLVRCSEMLNSSGILSFVLPAELLQVKFSTELRDYLTKKFKRIEIFTFNQLLFDCKGQDTVLLFGFKEHSDPGTFYTTIEDIEQLRNNDFRLEKNLALAETNTKWTHHFLAEGELKFVHALSERLKRIDSYCDAKPGIVTAANSYFIVNHTTEQMFGLEQYSKPIIQKGAYVNGSVLFTKNDFEDLVERDYPTKFLAFNNDDKFDERTQTYIDRGQLLKLPSRHKCKKRKQWYVVPNVADAPEGFFFKRSHAYPKLLKNEANVWVTDSGYKISMHPSYNIEDLIFSFYNSLTLVFSELRGRYYGGGVLELTPSEFKSLPVPYVKVSTADFRNFVSAFEAKDSISDVLQRNDKLILGKTLGLSDKEILEIGKIYRKLVAKRLRSGIAVIHLNDIN